MNAVMIYRALLRVLPRPFRARYGEQMVAMFEDEWRATGGAARTRVAFRSLRGLLWTALVVRVSSEYATESFAHERPAGGWFTGTGVDVRTALRGLARRPGFTAAAIATSALGIGAMVSVFSVVDQTVLRSLDLPDQKRVVGFWTSFERNAANEYQVSMAELADIRADLKSFDRVGAWSTAQTSTFTPKSGDSRSVAVVMTIGDVYALVNARTVLGRLPDQADDQPDALAVALVSHEFWQQAFGGAGEIVGKQTIDTGVGESALIIGVLAADVELPGGTADVWLHHVLRPEDYSWGRSGHGLSVIARLRSGVAVEQARSEIARMEGVWPRRYPGEHAFGNQGHRLGVASIDERLLGNARKVARILLTATALLLILACGNVANLLLARGETRVSEVGVRLALGSSRSRVARPVVIEGLVISLAGGLTGLILTWFALPALLHFAPESIRTVEPGLNRLVIAFALAISIATGLLFALAPSITAARRDPAILIRASSRTRTSLTRGLRILVATQTGLATLLLISAGLLGKSMRQLNAVDPGVAAYARVALNLNLPSSRYRRPERVIAFYDALQQRVAAQPGITAAVMIRHVPLRDGFRRENVFRADATGPGSELSVALQAAGPGVLRTMGIPLLAGRDLESGDRPDGVRVGLINEAAAKALWPGEPAIGKRLRATFTPRDFPPITIVGVYADVRSAGLSSAPTPELVLPAAQCGMMLGWLFNPKLVVHAAGDPARVVELARAAVRALDPAVAAEEPTTMQDVLYDSAARERFLTFLLSLFALLAVAIAGIGVFGVVSFTVAKQRREFALRNALGAQPGQILRGVVRTNALVAGAGALLGAAAAVAYAPVLSSFLYQVSPRDPGVVGGMPMLIVALALVSALVPAWRATRVPAAHLLQDGE